MAPGVTPQVEGDEAALVRKDNSRLSVSTARGPHNKRFDLRRLLPSEIPHLRLAGADDAALLSEWRCDQGKKTAPASEMFIIESASRPIGGLALHRSGRTVSISYLFVVPMMRRKRIGSYAISFVVSHAMDTDAAEIRIDLEKTNSAALHAFTACGFTHGHKASGHSFTRLQREARQFERVSDVGFSYCGLTGENIIRVHRTLIDIAARGLSEVPDVHLVLALGSAGRGFAA